MLVDEPDYVMIVTCAQTDKVLGVYEKCADAIKACEMAFKSPLKQQPMSPFKLFMMDTRYNEDAYIILKRPVTKLPLKVW